MRPEGRSAVVCQNHPRHRETTRGDFVQRFRVACRVRCSRAPAGRPSALQSTRKRPERAPRARSRGRSPMTERGAGQTRAFARAHRRASRKRPRGALPSCNFLRSRRRDSGAPTNSGGDAKTRQAAPALAWFHSRRKSQQENFVPLRCRRPPPRSSVLRTCVTVAAETACRPNASHEARSEPRALTDPATDVPEFRLAGRRPPRAHHREAR